MPRIIAFDLVRLFLAPLFLAPRGIDRVDLALAQHIFPDGESPHLGILPTPWGIRAFRAHEVLRIIDHAQHIWAEGSAVDADLSQDPLLGRVVEAICDHKPGHDQAIPPQQHSTPGSRRLTLGNKVVRMIEELRSTGLPPGRSAPRRVPRGAIYLNVGQIGLAVPLFFRWLEQRPDITCAMMLHDVIPLEYPDLVRPGQADHHARMVRTAARHADCMIYTTAYARDSVNVALSEHARPWLPSLVRSLPLSAAFCGADSSVPALAGKRYFLVISTVEPRKNHALLLRVWQRLIARFGKHAPHLVIVGARGFDADAILAPIDHKPTLRRHIHEVAGLSSAALAALMLNATAVLSPTWVEGFGLPVLEANLLGVPTIASNIAAHREIANASTMLLPCDDDNAWEQAIAALPTAIPDRRRNIPPEATEHAYCMDVLNFLQATSHNLA